MKLVDFGLSKKLDPAKMRTFSIVGTLLYLAPEALRGTGYGTSVDVWALGVLIFELAVGRLPFGWGKRTPGGTSSLLGLSPEIRCEIRRRKDSDSVNAPCCPALAFSRHASSRRPRNVAAEERTYSIGVRISSMACVRSMACAASMCLAPTPRLGHCV